MSEKKKTTKYKGKDIPLYDMPKEDKRPLKDRIGGFVDEVQWKMKSGKEELLKDLDNAAASIDQEYREGKISERKRDASVNALGVAAVALEEGTPSSIEETALLAASPAIAKAAGIALKSVGKAAKFLKNAPKAKKAAKKAEEVAREKAERDFFSGVKDDLNEFNRAKNADTSKLEDLLTARKNLMKKKDQAVNFLRKDAPTNKAASSKIHEIDKKLSNVNKALDDVRSRLKKGFGME